MRMDFDMKAKFYSMICKNERSLIMLKLDKFLKEFMTKP